MCPKSSVLRVTSLTFKLLFSITVKEYYKLFSGTQNKAIKMSSDHYKTILNSMCETIGSKKEINPVTAKP